MSIGPQQPLFPDDVERITRVKELSSSAESRVHLIQRTLPVRPIRNVENALAEGSDRATDASGQGDENALSPVEDSGSTRGRSGSNTQDQESAAASNQPAGDSDSAEAEEDCGGNLNLRY